MSADDARAIWRSDEKGFDLLLSDYIMPGGKGDELVHELCALSPALKCLIVTGHGLSESQIDPSLKDRVTILEKSVTRPGLLDAVADLLKMSLNA